MKAGIIRINGKILRELLQLPDGAVVVDIDTDIYRNGDILLKMRGMGGEVEIGEMLPEITGTIHRADGVMKVVWK